jgi:hypothetical protein
LQKVAKLTFFTILRDFGGIFGFPGFLGHFAFIFPHLEILALFCFGWQLWASVALAGNFSSFLIAHR